MVLSEGAESISRALPQRAKLSKTPLRTRLAVHTEPTRESKRQRSTKVFKDWAFTNTRDAVLERALAILGEAHGLTSIEFSGTKTREELGHGRGMVLSFENGNAWAIHLDHGLGFLTVMDSSLEFEHEAVVEVQARRLHEDAYDLCKSDAGPSLLFAQAKNVTSS